MGDDLFERMRRNPAGDWTIADIQRLCRLYEIDCLPPTGGGSHFKVHHAGVMDILTIPARRPIKPRYIRLLVSFVRIVVDLRART